MPSVEAGIHGKRLFCILCPYLGMDSLYPATLRLKFTLLVHLRFGHLEEELSSCNYDINQLDEDIMSVYFNYTC